MNGLHVTDAHLTPARPRDRATGLLAYIEFELNGTLAVDGATLRRSAEGAEYVCYPARTDRSGARHPYVRPVNDAARRDLECQVLRALGLGGTAE